MSKGLDVLISNRQKIVENYIFMYEKIYEHPNAETINLLIQSIELIKHNAAIGLASSKFTCQQIINDLAQAEDEEMVMVEKMMDLYDAKHEQPFERALVDAEIENGRDFIAEYS